MHPNLPGLYRRKVETLEIALADPATAAAAAEALRGLIDASLVFPGERRGEVMVQLRGDLEQFWVGQTHIGQPEPARRRFGNPFRDPLGSTEPVKTKSALGLTWGERFDDAALGDPAMPALSDQRV